MPRDNDKNNDSRGRRDRPSGGKGRSGAARGPEKKFAKRGFAGKSDGDKRPGKPDGAKSMKDGAVMSRIISKSLVLEAHSAKVDTGFA